MSLLELIKAKIVLGAWKLDYFLSPPAPWDATNQKIVIEALEEHIEIEKMRLVCPKLFLPNSQYTLTYASATKA